jgi:DNA ligase-1
MKSFARLFYELDQTNKTNEKVGKVLDYLRLADDEDKIRMLGLFTGRRPKRVINTSMLRAWASEASCIPVWLFDECYTTVGDLSETIALVTPNSDHSQNFKLTYWIDYIEDLQNKSEEEKKQAILNAWNLMTAQEKFVFNKLTSSTFRVGISQNLIIRALAQFSGKSPNVIADRLMGNWDPKVTSFQDLIIAEHSNQDISRPYPFNLAHPIESSPKDLGPEEEWSAEWKWDGIRAQLIYRMGRVFIWSRGEDLMSGRFPEIEAVSKVLEEDVVIDGELLPFKNGKILPFNILQTRIGRKAISSRILKDAPVVMFAYDLLEYHGKDIREWPLIERQNLLAETIEKANFKPYLQLSPLLNFSSWDDLAKKRKNSRQMMAEGIMLKRKSSSYQVGRKRGDWWKWKIDPLTIDAVLIYANRGTGKRSNLYTDYTFALWKDKELVPFAKAYSGLNDKEIADLDRWIRNNTIEKFGPVRTVKPYQVFEIGFEGILESSRHKSGVAVRFPRILRWRNDKTMHDADTVTNLISLMNNINMSS